MGKNCLAPVRFQILFSDIGPVAFDILQRVASASVLGYNNFGTSSSKRENQIFIQLTGGTRSDCNEFR